MRKITHTGLANVRHLSRYGSYVSQIEHAIGHIDREAMHTLYTWGYSGSKPLDLLNYQRSLNATVCDIRFSPRSRMGYWNGGAVKALLPKDRYFHMIELGNVNYKNDLRIELYKPHEVVRDIELVLTYHPAILLCGCADWRECHRRT